VRHAEWPRQSLYSTFRKQISGDEQANMLAVPRKQRAMIRKGIKNGLQSAIDSSVDRFFALYADNVHRHGTPALPKKFFAQLHERFGDACEVLTVTDPAGRPLSSVMSFYFRDEVLPYYAGDDVAAREFAANDFKYWELMRRACVRGCKVFDFGRSKAGTGPFSFKKNWGFEPEPLSYEYRLYETEEVPQKNPLNPKYRAFIEIWRRLPLPLANEIGPPIARLLG
jgi:FemAB-related protein (PEP-CTERM system-associated)